jgi:hypothetical protein
MRVSKPVPTAMYDDTPAGAKAAPAAGLEAALLGALALPWFVHAAVVGLSLVARPLAGRTVAIALLLLACTFVAVLVRTALRARAAGPNAALPGLPAGAQWSARVLAGGALAAFVAAFVIALSLPVIAYDALAYRLPVIAQWLDAGRVAWVSSDDPVRNGYPLGQEAVSAVLVAATGAMGAASVTSFAYVACGALSIWALSEACGVRRELARAAGALFVLAPMTLLNAPSGYVDAAFAGATVALFCTSALCLLRPQPDAWSCAAAGMAAAHVLALKGTGIAFVACALLCVGCVLALRGLRAHRRRQVVFTPALLRLLLVAGVCVLPGAFWVVRNVAFTGNPLWPVEVKVAGHVLFAGVASMDAVLSAASNTPPELASLGEGARLLRVWLQMNGPAADFDDRLSGLGFAWVLFALPALIACMWGVARSRAVPTQARALLLVLAMTVGCLVLQPLRWWPRYTLWLWGAGALALALQAEGLARAGRRFRLSTALTLLAVVCVSEAGVALIHVKDIERAAGRWLGSSPTTRNLADARNALNARSWIAPDFWDLALERAPDVCRGAWKPNTDNANLDGVFAQLQPRPHVHILPDDQGSWDEVRRAWKSSGCPRLLLLQGSPVLASAAHDPKVSVAPAVAFDPIFVVGPPIPVAMGGRPDAAGSTAPALGGGATVGRTRFGDLSP